MNYDVIIIILLVIVAILSVVFIPQWRLKRAIPKVLRIFRAHNAVDMKNAKSLEEMGLQPRGLLDTLLKGRDYRQYALNALMQGGIILMNEGKLYLSEDKLASTSLEEKK